MASTPGLFNLARMTVSSTGTGTITLNAAVSGFLTFDLAGCSTASTGQRVVYAINDTTQSEIGVGTYTSSALSLTRDSSTTGLISTNSNQPINMSNTAQVFITPNAAALPPNFAGQLATTISSDTLFQPASSATFSTVVSVAQGSTGVWHATANFTFQNNNGGTANMVAKLWDGTNVINSGVLGVGNNAVATMALSGWITNPSGNLTLSVSGSTHWTAYRNISGSSADTVIAAHRIA